MEDYPPTPSIPAPPVAPPPTPEIPPPMPQPQTTFTNLALHDPTPPSKRGSRVLVIILISIVVLLLAGAGVYATFVLRAPEQKIKQAFANMAKLDSVVANGAFTSSATSQNTSTAFGNFNLTFSSQLDNKSKTFALQTVAKVLTRTVKADIIGVSDVVYLKLEGVADILAGTMGGSSKEAGQFKQLLESKYIRISQEDLKNAGLPAGSTQLQGTISPQLSSSDQQKWSDLLTNTDFFKVTEKLGSKTVNGTSASGYKIVLQAEGMKQIARGLRDLDSFKNRLGTQNQEEFEKGLGEMKQSDLDKVPFQIWISGDYISQVVIGAEDNGTKVELELSFSRFNESFDIKAPADSRPLHELLKGLHIPGLSSGGDASLFSPGSLL